VNEISIDGNQTFEDTSILTALLGKATLAFNDSNASIQRRTLRIRNCISSATSAVALPNENSTGVEVCPGFLECAKFGRKILEQSSVITIIGDFVRPMDSLENNYLRLCVSCPNLMHLEHTGFSSPHPTLRILAVRKIRDLISSLQL